MTRFARTLAFVMLFGLNAGAAERHHERLSLSLSNRAGLVTAPFVTLAFPEVSGFGDALTATAAVQFSALGWLHLSLPVAIVKLDFPAGAQVTQAALGNVEFGLEHPIEPGPSTRVGLLAALLAPTAEHGSKTALLDNRALALASTLSGGKDSALLTPGVMGLRLGVSVGHSARPFDLRASLDLPLLVRVSDASLPDSTETHAIGIVPALELKGTWWITSGFAASLGAALIIEAVRVQEPVLERDRNRRFQPVAERGLQLRLGQHLVLDLDGNVPVGGALGGNAWSVGTHARLGL